MPVEHEHASVSLKVILLIFAVLLVGVLGYLVWDFKNTPDTTDYSTKPMVVKEDDDTETPAPSTSVTTTPTDETANWETYENKSLGFSLKYPTDWVITVYTAVTLSSSDSTKDCEPGSIGLEKASPHDLDLFIGVCPSTQISNEISSYENAKTEWVAGTTTISGKVLKTFSSNYNSITLNNPHLYILSSFYADKGFKVDSSAAVENLETVSKIVKTLVFSK